ncbi:hypothetical protein CEUSTIGMA_g12354.t1 [Chlamydomonas eustigma]|uniref:Methyltransferase small domain-containing protein n=1 Tax=Chlamydomonas eustigma TaxID=1157962 RepID=A0A250XPK1_9CHLO|nr:hypothetical protein CEUSTIGMA_g12354.t1 [Chlamydomonas eustigma]|eukprot:GAX84933.1 hypothetical protein CEUSTIGMA_g12354.t1 [Chlamydomonas eustigma]
MGSGLLWARSTGLKVWPGAMALSTIMLNDMNRVISTLIGAQAAACRQSPEHLPPFIPDIIVNSDNIVAHEDPAVKPKCQGHSEFLNNEGALNKPVQHPVTIWTWQGKVVVELGCGLALCSIVAAQQGAQVIATDGDADLIQVARRNIVSNTSGAHFKPLTAVLPWGDDQALERLLIRIRESYSSTPNCLQQQQLIRQQGGVDVVVLSDVVYGSNPGVWENLARTLRGLSCCNLDNKEMTTSISHKLKQDEDSPAEKLPCTLILQSETSRVEGVLYDVYWKTLENAGFKWVPLSDDDCNSLKSNTDDLFTHHKRTVKSWAIWLAESHNQFESTS